jgi:hypothetical protein
MGASPKFVNKLPAHMVGKVVAGIASGERPVHPAKHIDEWDGLTRAERAILKGIAKGTRRQTSSKGLKGWRSATMAEIAGDTKYEERQVRRIVKRLEGKKVIERKRTSSGPGSTTGFAIHRQSCCFKSKA